MEYRREAGPRIRPKALDALQTELSGIVKSELKRRAMNAVALERATGLSYSRAHEVVQWTQGRGRFVGLETALRVAESLRIPLSINLSVGSQPQVAA